MKFFGILFLTFLACALAVRDQCPHPEDAGDEVVDESINLSAPLVGVEAVEIDIAEDVIDTKIVSCVTMTSNGGGNHGGPSAVALGQNRRGGISLLLVTGEKEPLNARVQAYGVGRPGPNRQIPARFL